MKQLVDENLLLTAEGAKAIHSKASALECECPKHLIEILEKVREFKKYEQSCINKNEKDKQTHEWLLQAATNIDQMISTTIVQLARLENMIDEDNNILNHKNSKAS